MSTDDAEYLWNRRSSLKLHAMTNRFYQQERQRIMEFREGAIKALSLAAGSVAFANIASHELVAACGAVVVIGNAVSLVFGFGSKARDAARRSVEWTAIDHEINAAGERGFTESMINEWSARCTEIESGEPAPHPGLLERSYLRACEAIGATPSPSNWWQKNRPVIALP